jgi:hypothetical protein
MVEIPLTRGLVATVDDQDAHLASFVWHAAKCNGKFYAARRVYKGPYLYLHRVVLGVPAGVEVDHVDGNGLNCRRGNLRPATRQEQNRNRRTTKRSKSGFKGVFYQAGLTRPWRAQITVDGRTRSLGCFGSPEAAALAYNEAARELHGEFAKLNEVTRV